MPESSAARDRQLAELAAYYGFGDEAVAQLWRAVSDGGGDMASFDHPEFLGPGQWMRGGLILITDPADRVLKNRIDSLCNALSRALREDRAPAVGQRRLNAEARAWDTPGNLRRAWWPGSMGDPDAAADTGALAYAYFDRPRLLAIRRDDTVTWYDTGVHRITGIAYDDGRNETLVMTSTIAEVPLNKLTPQVGASDTRGTQVDTRNEAPPIRPKSEDILDAIARLAELYRQGALTENEFAAKKRELLARL